MAGSSSRPVAGHGAHLVQFYGDDEELSASVGGVLGEGLAEGCPAVVVATPAHRAAFGARLGAGAGHGTAGSLLLADCAGTLDSFLAGGRIDPARFRDTMSGLIGRAAEAGQPVRVYGEMVAQLWDAGQVALALELETLWNGLLAELPFTLLCGYPAGLMAGHEDTAALDEVRRLHSAVISPGPHPPGAAWTSPGGSDTVRHFPAGLESARLARHFVEGVLGSQAGRAVVTDASIIAGELAGNAVLHARSAFTVTVSRSAESLRITVRDNAPLENGRPLPARPGHGLGIVARLASRWAVEPLPGGKLIWAELPATAARAAVRERRPVSPADVTDAGTGPDDGVRVARLPPVVDIANAAGVRAELGGLLADGVRVLVADMTATTALSMEGVHSLLLVRTLAKKRGAQLRLAAVNPRVRRYMALTGTDQLFPLYASVDHARTAAGPRAT